MRLSANLIKFAYKVASSKATVAAEAATPTAQEEAVTAVDPLGHGRTGEQKIPGMKKTPPGAVSRAGTGTASASRGKPRVTRPTAIQRALPGAGAAPLTTILGAAALNDARREGALNAETFAYGARALNPFSEDFNLVPYGETLAQIAGVGSLMDPDFRAEMSRSAPFLGTLRQMPRATLDEMLGQATDVGKSVGRLAKDIATGVNAAGEGLKGTGRRSNLGQSTPMGTGRPTRQQ